MEFEKVIRERHATRKYKSERIEKEIIEKILEAGRIAPSAKNQQPVRIFVIESEEGLNKLDKATPCRYGALTVLLICGDKKEAWSKDGFSSYEMDSCIAATQMMLAATSLGIQNIWIELFDKNIIREEFALTDNLEPICLIPIGYEADDCPASPNHNVRKLFDEIVTYC